MVKKKRSFYGSRKRYKSIPLGTGIDTDHEEGKYNNPYEEIKDLAGTSLVFRWEKEIDYYGREKRFYGPLSAYNHDDSLKYANNYVRHTMVYIEDATDVKGFNFGMICGACDVYMLNAWVNFSAAAICEADGFVIGIYEVPNNKLFRTDEQVVFHPDNAKRLRGLSYIDFIREYGPRKLTQRKEEKFNLLKQQYIEDSMLGLY